MCVVGEFKQGKSSLVNALLGSSVCPVDDDLATSAITLVRYGEQVSVVVRRRDGDQAVSEPISADDDPRVGHREPATPTTSSGSSGSTIGMPSPVLKQGLVIVDTPGHGRPRGRSRRGHARVPALRRRADLRQRRVVGAQRARGRLPRARRPTLCPTVLFVADQDRPLPRVAAHRRAQPRPPRRRRSWSSTRRGVEHGRASEALADKDRELNERAAAPGVARHAQRTTSIEPAKASALGRSLTDGRAVARARCSRGSGRGRALLSDPSQRGEIAAAPRATPRRASSTCAVPARSGARSSATASPTCRATINHDFRGGMRTITRAHRRAHRGADERQGVGRARPRPPDRGRRARHRDVHRPSSRATPTSARRSSSSWPRRTSRSRRSRHVDRDYRRERPVGVASRSTATTTPKPVGCSGTGLTGIRGGRAA